CHDPATPNDVGGVSAARQAAAIRVSTLAPASPWKSWKPSRATLGRVIDPVATAETRVDRWLSAVRLVKTRPLATRLCDGGHVLANGMAAKPATKGQPGDRGG